MARKKKQKVATKVLENTASTRGNVKITMFRKNKKIGSISTHNTGTIYLCEYLRDSMIGKNVIARRPGIIKICKKNESSILEPIYDYGVAYTDAWVNTSSDISASATISFLIPSSILTSGMVIQGLQLFSLGTNGEEYAELDLTQAEDPETKEVSDQSITVTGDTNLEIEWTLKVSYQ